VGKPGFTRLPYFFCMGHTEPALALEIYTKVMERRRDTGALAGERGFF